ncbi:MAG: FAD-binding oxidoreductase [Ilumatobacteraceae bacterium]
MVSLPPVDERYTGDWSDTPRHQPRAVLRPRTTDDVATALRTCNEFGQGVVPQGGRTGLAGAATPRAADVVLSLERMTGIEHLDTAAGTVTVLAGTVLEHVQQAIAAAGWELGYDLGARGSCQIGGNLATNAGGNRVLRYGMAREQVLGLEVVLADGTVVSSLHTMLKNNAGYDLKHWFIGSEGTLGVITRAVLRLHPRPATRHTALVAVPSYAATVELLRHAQQRAGGITAFEAMWPFFYRYVAEHLGVTPPVATGAGMYALVEMSGDDPAHDEARVEAMLAEAVERGLAVDAVVARSARDTETFWRIREGEPIDRLPSVINFDVSLPIADIEDFADACVARLLQRWPDGYVFVFGHIGDSNLHLCVSIGPSTPDEQHEVDDVVYDAVREWRGSVSAEHGIGTLKREYLGYSRSVEELDTMRRMKRALDPNGILNPGKVLDLDAAR